MYLMLPKVDTLGFTALFLTARNVTSKSHTYFSNISIISPFKQMQLILFSNSLQTALRSRRELCKYVVLKNNLQAKGVERFLERVKSAQQSLSYTKELLRTLGIFKNIPRSFKQSPKTHNNEKTGNRAPVELPLGLQQGVGMTHSSFMWGFVLGLQPPVCIPRWSMQRTTRYLRPWPHVTVHWKENARERRLIAKPCLLCLVSHLRLFKGLLLDKDSRWICTISYHSWSLCSIWLFRVKLAEN